MGTSCAGNAMLVGRTNSKNLMKGFIVFLRWVMIVSHSYCLLDRSIQPANVRSAEETVLDVEYQVRLACLGVAQTVQNEQTKTGVKDAYTQYWIDYLIDRARTLRKENPRRTATDIQTELLTWVEEHKNKIYNPFLKLDGEYFPFDFCRRCLILLFDRVQCCYRYSGGNSSHHSPRHCEIPVARLAYFMDSQSKTDVLSSFTIN